MKSAINLRNSNQTQTTLETLHQTPEHYISTSTSKTSTAKTPEQLSEYQHNPVPNEWKNIVNAPGLIQLHHVPSPAATPTIPPSPAVSLNQLTILPQQIDHLLKPPISLEQDK